MSETDMIREAVKGFLKPIIAEAMAEVAVKPTVVEGKRYYTREEAQDHRSKTISYPSSGGRGPMRMAPNI